MFVLYLFGLIYIWVFFLCVVTIFEHRIQRLYWIWEQPTILFGRDFTELGYLEKIFLMLFYRDKMYVYSIANVSDENDIYQHRVLNYPVLNSFHAYINRANYQHTNLKNLIKQCDLLVNNKFTNKKYLKIIDFWISRKKPLTRSTTLIRFLVMQDTAIQLFLNDINYQNFDVHNKNDFIFSTFWFFAGMRKCKNKLYYFRLIYFRDWYIYTFSKILKRRKDKIIFSNWNLRTKKRMREVRRLNLFKNFYNYHIWYKLSKPILSFKMNFSKALKKTLSVKPKIKMFPVFYKFHKLIYPIRYKDTSNVKNINYNNIKNYSFFFLRKNRIFNKGRYSRNRQLYRTGVYWCLWLNVIVVYGLYFLFYRFSFNFGYIWYGMFFLILSTIFGRMFKYRFYNVYELYNEIISLKIWFSCLVFEFMEFLYDLFYIFVTYYSFFFLKLKKKLQFIVTNEYKVFNYLFNKLDFVFYSIWKSKKIYIWELMEEDKSFLRYKTVLHWIKQIYRSITI